MDMIARELGLDPADFRRRNILRNGRPQASGTLLRDADIEKSMDQVMRHLAWDQPYDHGKGRLRKGRGLAIGFKDRGVFYGNLLQVFIG